MTSSTRTAVAEVVVATAVVAVVIFVVQWLGAIWSAAQGYGAAIVAGAFLGVPMLVARWRGWTGDVHGLAGGSLHGAAGWGIVLTLIVALPFGVGFDQLQTRWLDNERGAGPGLEDFPAEFAGKPQVVGARLSVHADGDALAISNGLAEAIVVAPRCDRLAAQGCEKRVVRPGAGIRLLGAATASFSVSSIDGKPLSTDRIGTGATSLRPGGQPLEAPRSLWWLVWSLLTQLLVVAVPEEAFFRGYVQGRLRACWVPKRTVFGQPFGMAHVVAAGLFASIHLVTNPSPGRLLVFFPGLLFAWLAEKNRNVIGAATHHALSNVMLQVARRFYG